MAAPCATGFSTSDSLIGIPAPLVRWPVSVLATLYITTGPAENGCIFFHSIVFIPRINCAWKTGTVLWNKGMIACGYINEAPGVVDRDASRVWLGYSARFGQCATGSGKQVEG
jgi:hypothetical protein